MILADPMTRVCLIALYQEETCTHRETHRGRSQDPSGISLIVSGSRNHTARCKLWSMDLGRSEINRGETFFFSGGEITAISPCYGG